MRSGTASGSMRFEPRWTLRIRPLKAFSVASVVIVVLLLARGSRSAANYRPRGDEPRGKPRPRTTAEAVLGSPRGGGGARAGRSGDCPDRLGPGGVGRGGPGRLPLAW